MQEERENIIILIDDEGKEMPFEVLDIIEEDDKRYAVGIPAEEAEEDAEEGTVLIMRIVPANEEEDILEPIEDQAELEKIFEIFKTRMEEEFDFEDEDSEQ